MWCIWDKGRNVSAPSQPRDLPWLPGWRPSMTSWICCVAKRNRCPKSNLKGGLWRMMTPSVTRVALCCPRFGSRLNWNKKWDNRKWEKYGQEQMRNRIREFKFIDNSFETWIRDWIHKILSSNNSWTSRMRNFLPSIHGTTRWSHLFSLLSILSRSLAQSPRRLSSYLAPRARDNHRRLKD